MPSDQLIPYLFFGGMLVLVVTIVSISIHYSRKRTRELTEVAQQIGFQFVGNAWTGPSLSSQHKTSLLQRTRGRFSNIMTGSSVDSKSVSLTTPTQREKPRSPRP